MVTITVKNIPEELYESIKLHAKANRRSVNSEIISIFEQAIPKRTPMDVKEILERGPQSAGTYCALYSDGRFLHGDVPVLALLDSWYSLSLRPR